VKNNFVWITWHEWKIGGILKEDWSRIWVSSMNTMSVTYACQVPVEEEEEAEYSEYDEIPQACHNELLRAYPNRQVGIRHRFSLVWEDGCCLTNPTLFWRRKFEYPSCLQSQQPSPQAVHQLEKRNCPDSAEAEQEGKESGWRTVLCSVSNWRLIATLHI